jgi:hypothetical protein
LLCFLLSASEHYGKWRASGGERLILPYLGEAIVSPKEKGVTVS